MDRFLQAWQEATAVVADPSIAEQRNCGKQSRDYHNAFAVHTHCLWHRAHGIDTTSDKKGQDSYGVVVIQLSLDA